MAAAVAAAEAVAEVMRTTPMTVPVAVAAQTSATQPHCRTRPFRLPLLPVIMAHYRSLVVEINYNNNNIIVVSIAL